jgi:hypothetical protein
MSLSSSLRLESRSRVGALIDGVRNMSDDQNAANERNGGKKVYAVNIQAKAKAQSSTSCSFCWFVLTLYPTLKGMTDRDSTTFKMHLEKAHGLRKEIER